MKILLQFNKLENIIVKDPKLLFTLTCYLLNLITYINLNTVKSPVIGVVTSTPYFLINIVFLSHAFFQKEETFFRLMFGILMLIMFLGFVGWLTMTIYNLDVTMFALVLLIVATISSLLNRRMKRKNAT